MTEALFQPLTAGALTLPNRILLAPLTRSRADAGHVPNDLMAQYYAQRAEGGLLITEATIAMEGCSSFLGRDPGIYNDEQVAGWRKTTDAVHAAGGQIVVQIWHGGRACHPIFNNGVQPVAPSAIAIEDEVHTPEGKKPYTVPRELSDDEIPAIVAGFKKAAENAKAAGFDGVEVHGANGYLLDEFLRDGANKRTGAYGGSIENRARLLLEVLQATIDVWGSDRVGLRISPLNSYNSMKDSDPIALVTWLAKRLNDFNLAYLHLMRADFFQQQTGDVVTPVREHYKGRLIVNMGYDANEAGEAIRNGVADAVSFGTSFLANPDLPTRIKRNAPLNAPDPSTFYGGDAKGYTDYPKLSA